MLRMVEIYLIWFPEEVRISYFGCKETQFDPKKKYCTDWVIKTGGGKFVHWATVQLQHVSQCQLHHRLCFEHDSCEQIRYVPDKKATPSECTLDPNTLSIDHRRLFWRFSYLIVVCQQSNWQFFFFCFSFSNDLLSSLWWMWL